MFEPEDEVLVAADVCPEPAGLREAWNRTVDAVLAEATLARPAEGWMQSGGRAGRHTEHLGHMLAVMQSVARAHPGAKW
jgi:ring-1,2-phenylacetyl-CoA epoxidase subunit PaaC